MTERDLRPGTRTGKQLNLMLDSLDWTGLVDELGPPDRVTTVMREGGREWSPGDPRPALASGEPAVTQAMARCLTWRALRRPVGPISPGAIHPRTCSWCDYPTREVQAAVDWGGWDSRLIEVQYATWWGSYGSHYDRATPQQGTYTSPAWAAFFGTAPHREEAGRMRRALIDAAMYGGLGG